MSTLWKVLLIILVVLIIALIVLYFVGRRLERRQAEQQVQIEAAKQNVTLLIIDKKRVPLKDAGLPDAVIESTPKLLRRSKMPIVKVKYGPKVIDGVVVDGSINGDFDFTKAYDDFCKELVALSKLSERERHPDVLFEEDLDKMDFSGIVPMPTMESNDQPIDESRIVREEWTDENGNKVTRFKYAD